MNLEPWVPSTPAAFLFFWHSPSLSNRHEGPPQRELPVGICDIPARTGVQRC